MFLPLVVDIGHHDEAVVDDDACQRDQPKHRHHAEGDAHKHVAPDRTDETEWNRAHDDQRLHVRLEWNRQQREDRQQCDGETGLETGNPFRLLGLHAFKCPMNSRVALEHVREDPGFEVGVDGGG